MLHLFIYAIFILSAIHGIQTRSIQNDTLENRIVALEKLVEKLEDRIKNGTNSSKEDTICPKEAFFYARLSATRTLNTYSVIKFDKIMINNGNHYHPTDGVFVAPISGVYMFSWNTLTFNNKGLYTELRVENEVKGAVASNAASGFYTPGSTSLLCHVKKGEHVWVQTSSGTSTNYLHDWNDSTSFMGFWLQKD